MQLKRQIGCRIEEKDGGPTDKEGMTAARKANAAAKKRSDAAKKANATRKRNAAVKPVETTPEAALQVPE